MGMSMKFVITPNNASYRRGICFFPTHVRMGLHSYAMFRRRRKFRGLFISSQDKLNRAAHFNKIEQKKIDASSQTAAQ